MRDGVVPAQGQQLQVSGRPVGLEFREVGASVPYFFHHGDAVHFHPVLRSRQGMQQALGVGLPIAQVEVEIMLSVARQHGAGGAGGGDCQPQEALQSRAIHGFARVSLAMKTGTQVLPPSFEYDSS